MSVVTPGAEQRQLEIPEGPLATAHENTTLHGEVHRAGGSRGTVEISFPGHGIVTCNAGRDLAERLGAQLYHQVAVSGRASRDGLGRLIDFEIESFRAAGRARPSDALAVLHAKVGTALDDLDPEAVIAERRS